MNSMHELTRFLSAASNDPRISACHISLYLSLYQSWINNLCKDLVPICREEVMKTAKINALTTHYKRMKELGEYGYIRYLPSNNPMSNSKVFISC